MKKLFEQLNPLERRFTVGILVILILVLNWVFIWPHFSDLGNLRRRISDAEGKLVKYQETIQQSTKYVDQLKGFESQGEFVPQEDQSINLLRIIQSQAAASGIGMVNPGRSQTSTDDPFFVEQVQSITVTAPDAKLVDFLYKLGNNASMVRVRDLELMPDASHFNLTAQIRLVASYQKNPKANLKSTTANAK